MSDIEQEKAAASIEHKEHSDHPHHIGFHETDLEPMGLPTEVSPEDNKRIKRKIDWVLMPILGVITALQFLDKTMLAYSSIMGFIYDSQITLSQYSWLGTIFSLGYLLGSYPMVYLQQRLSFSKVTATCMIMWGAVVMLITICHHNFAGLLVVRFFLGFFESAMTPACVLVTTQWYRVHEQGTRTGIWSSCNTWGLIFGSAVAYGLLHAQINGHLTGMVGWRVEYLILGSMTIATGIVWVFVIPDDPEKAWWLSKKDRHLAHLRTADTRQDITVRDWKWEQVKEAMADIQIWAFVLVALLTAIPGGGITNFAAVLVTGLGFGTQEALLMGIGQAWVAPFTILCLWAGDKLRCRSLISIFPSIVSMTGAAMIYAFPQSKPIPRAAGYYLMLTWAINTTAVTSFISSNVAGRTKKTMASGMFFFATCVGGLIGPQTFRSKDAPRYSPALLSIILCNIFAAAVMALLFLYYYKENKRRDARMAATGETTDVPDGVDALVMDLTDKENPKFRYVY